MSLRLNAIKYFGDWGSAAPFHLFFHGSTQAPCWWLTALAKRSQNYTKSKTNTDTNKNEPELCIDKY